MENIDINPGTTPGKGPKIKSAQMSSFRLSSIAKLLAIGPK